MRTIITNENIPMNTRNVTPNSEPSRVVIFYLKALSDINRADTI